MVHLTNQQKHKVSQLLPLRQDLATRILTLIFSTKKSDKQPYDPKFSSGHIRELEVAKRLIDKGISTDVELGGKELGRSRKLNKDIKLGGDVVDHTNHKVYQVKTVWSEKKSNFGGHTKVL
jgi:hypothetical protein